MEYHPRKIEEKLEKWIGRREVVVLKGARQTGKTTLFLHLKERLGGSYVTLEDEGALKSFEESPESFVKRYGDDYLFIDEAQYSKKAGKILKLLYDLYSERLKIFVTGSGSFDIKVNIGGYLVGRAVYFELFPLSFEEFILWKARDLYRVYCDQKDSLVNFVLEGENIEVSPAFEREFRELLSEYINFGGFPAVVKEEDEDIKKELLRNLVTTYVEKDVFFFLNVRQIEKFRRMLKLLAFNIGAVFEASSVMRELHMDFRTVESYLSILSSTYIVSLLQPYHKNLSTELKKSSKVYFFDTGLRNSLLNSFLPLEDRTDRGRLQENFVLNQLRHFCDRINYWRTTGRAEVDFVVNGSIPVEVKSEGRLRRGFYSFLRAYKPERAVVFTDREFGVRKINDTQVAFVPLFYA